jgi:DNA mismatch repair protein MutL
LNYIKSQRTEYNHILEYIQSIALFYPTVSFTLISDEKRSFFSPKTSQEERIKTIYSEELFNNLLLLDFEIHGVHISGYISDPKVHFPQKNRQILSVNKRLIKSPLLYRALQDAYNRYIPHGSFPAYILSLDLDPTQIDANVHPRKLELRFANEQDIYRSLYHGISGRLESVDLIQSLPQNDSSLSQTNPVKNNYYTGSGTKFQSYSPYTQKQAHPNQVGIDFTKTLL